MKRIICLIVAVFTIINTFAVFAAANENTPYQTELLAHLDTTYIPRPSERKDGLGSWYYGDTGTITSVTEDDRSSLLLRGTACGYIVTQVTGTDSYIDFSFKYKQNGEYAQDTIQMELFGLNSKDRILSVKNGKLYTDNEKSVIYENVPEKFVDLRIVYNYNKGTNTMYRRIFRCTDNMYRPITPWKKLNHAYSGNYVRFAASNTSELYISKIEHREVCNSFGELFPKVNNVSTSNNEISYGEEKLAYLDAGHIPKLSEKMNGLGSWYYSSAENITSVVKDKRLAIAIKGDACGYITTTAERCESYIDFSFKLETQNNCPADTVQMELLGIKNHDQILMIKNNKMHTDNGKTVIYENLSDKWYDIRIAYSYCKDEDCLYRRIYIKSDTDYSPVTDWKKTTFIHSGNYVKFVASNYSNMWISKIEHIKLFDNTERLKPLYMETKVVDSEVTVEFDREVDKQSVGKDSFRVLSGDILDVKCENNTVTIVGANITEIGFTERICDIYGMPYQEVYFDTQGELIADYKNPIVNVPVQRKLTNFEENKLSAVEAFLKNTSSRQICAGKYDASTGCVTFKLSDLKRMMSIAEPIETCTAQYIIKLPYYFNANEIKLNVTGDSVLSYLDLGGTDENDNAMEIYGGLIEATDKPYYKFTDSECHLVGMRERIDKDFYVDISVNTEDMSSDGKFSLNLAYGNDATAWIKLLDINKELFCNSVEISKSFLSDGWIELRIIMKKDTHGDYVRTVYCKNNDGHYMQVGDDWQVIGRINMIPEKINKVGYLSATGDAGVKIGEIYVYADDPDELYPFVKSVEYCSDNVTIEFSDSINYDTVGNIEYYNKDEVKLKNVNVSYDVFNRIVTAKAANIARIKYDGVFGENGMSLKDSESEIYTETFLGITDGDGYLITGTDGISSAIARLRINNSDEELSDRIKTVIIAAYDDNDKMVSANFSSSQIGIGVSLITSEIEISNECKKIKSFVFDGKVDEMKPSKQVSAAAPGNQYASVDVIPNSENSCIAKIGIDYAYVCGQKISVLPPVLKNGEVLMSAEDIANIYLSPVQFTDKGVSVMYLNKTLTFENGKSIMQVTEGADRTKKRYSMDASAQMIADKLYIPVKAFISFIENCKLVKLDDYVIFGENVVPGDYETASTHLSLRNNFSSDFHDGRIMKELYVDVCGDDKNDGSIEKPFKTIERAKQKIREIKKLNGMIGNINVYLRDGEYYTDGLSFDADDSGENGYFVNFMSYPNETAVVICGKRIDTWSEETGGIYSTAADSEKADVLIDENKFIKKARYPNDSYLKSKANTASENSNEMFVDGKIPKMNNICEAEVYVWPNNSFRNETAKIVGAAGGKITLNKGFDWSQGEVNRFYYRNDSAFLDIPGEFSYDGVKLLCIPENDISGVIIPRKSSLFGICGEEYGDRVRNIGFEGLTIIGCDEGYNAIDIRFATGIRINKCYFKSIGGNGVMADHSYNITVTDSLFDNIGGAAVCLLGQSTAKNSVAGRCSVVGNEMKNVGELNPNNGSGVMLSSVDNCIVSNNRIKNSPRFGINFSSVKTEYLNQTDIAFDDWNLYTRCKNNVISDNDISNIMYDSEDGGGIYAWNASTGNVIRRNYLHDSTSPVKYWMPIYIDDETDGTTIYENIVANNQNYPSDGYIMHTYFLKGRDNVMYNNIGVSNQNYSGADKNFSNVGTYYQKQSKPNRNTVKRNIFYDCGNNFVYIGESYWGNGDPQENRLKEQDYNMHYNTNGVYLPDVDWRDRESTLENWLNWLNKKYDKNTLFGVDPKFKSLQAEDYRLEYDSNAYSLGFYDIDYSKIGLLRGFSYADKNDTIDKVYITTADKCASFVELSVNDTVKLNVCARSKNGYLIEGDELSIDYDSSDSSIALTDAEGEIKALSDGKATVTVSVTYQGRTVTSEVDVISVMK